MLKKNRGNYQGGSEVVVRTSHTRNTFGFWRRKNKWRIIHKLRMLSIQDYWEFNLLHVGLVTSMTIKYVGPSNFTETYLWIWKGFVWFICLFCGVWCDVGAYRYIDIYIYKGLVTVKFPRKDWGPLYSETINKGIVGRESFPTIQSFPNFTDIILEISPKIYTEFLPSWVMGDIATSLLVMKNTSQ